MSKGPKRVQKPLKLCFLIIHNTLKIILEVLQNAFQAFGCGVVDFLPQRI